MRGIAVSVRSYLGAAVGAAVLVLLVALPAAADLTPQTLPFAQAWSNTSQITTDDGWSGVAGVVGYRGDAMTGATAVDPQTVTAEGGLVVDVNANRSDPSTFTTGGVTEFDGIANPVVALQGSGTARAPHLVLTFSTTGRSNVTVSYSLRDVDGSTDNAVQPVALQYRVGTSGAYTNVPAGFVADATTGPSLATLVTPVSVPLPAPVDDQPTVQVRIITTDAVGSDEWVGVDDISIDSSDADQAPAVQATTPADGADGVATNANVTITFSEPVDVTGSWFTISCASSGAHTAAVSGGPSTFTLDPAVDFVAGEACTVTVTSAGVTDQDANDPPDTMDGNAVFSFTTAGAALPPTLVINEVDYDQPSTDTAEFIEIKNVGTAAVGLDGVTVDYVNGTGGGAVSYRMTSLPDVSLAPGDYFVVCGNAASTLNCDLDVTPDTDLIQNGAPDALALVASSTILDAVSYEGNTGAPYTEGSGVGLVDTATGALESISRCPDGTDTDSNAADFQLRPATPGSTNACPGVDLAPAVASTTPAAGAAGVALDADLAITFNEPVNATGSWFTISCATSGVHLAASSGGPTTFTLDPTADFAPNETCTVTVHAADVTDQDADDPPDAMTADYTFGFTTVDVLVCGDAATPIHDVQGSGLTSPIVGAGVTVEGVVVGDYQPTPSEFGGFYLEEEDAQQDASPATSEGIFVFDGSFGVDVQPGDVVRVRGSVAEFNGLTELNAVNGVQVCSTGASVTPASVSLPVASLADHERFEGMLVSYGQTLTATEVFNLGRFGEVSLSGVGRLYTPTAIVAPGTAAIAQEDANDRSRIILDDGSNQQNIDPTRYPQGGLSATNTLRVGDTLPGLTGVMDFRFGNYRIQPVGPISFAHTNPRPAAPAPVGGDVRVASFNVLNFFNGDGLGGGFPTSRGADTQFELDRQTAKEVSALKAIDADIVGLMEIENDAGPTSAIAELVAALNAATAPGTYAYVDTGVIGTDEIKVALIYKPAKVTPVGPWRIITTATDPRFLDTKNRPSLAQTFERNGTGARLTVVVDHLKSKGSACNDVGDPDTGDGQGNCNVTRTNAAKALVDWLATDPTRSGDADFLLIGDFNAYTFEDPIAWITGHGYTNLVRQFGGLEAYSYVFDGESGYLDHGLASAALASQVTGATDWHINPDEPTVLDYNTEFKTANQVDTFYDPGPYRSSDHDPVVIGLDLTGPQCLGVDATITGSGTIVGTAGPDVIVGSTGDDTISGGGGDDLICGNLGDDTIDGGNGDDTVFGDAGISFGNPAAPGGDDTILGGGGDDEIAGEGGADTIDAGNGDDFATGNVGADTVNGGNGGDTLFGGQGADLVNGGNGDDSLFGTFGDDVLNGGGGDDFLDGDLPPDNDVGAGPGVDPTENHDSCDGGSGTDSAFGCEVTTAIETPIDHF